jgi:hypothetical protein
MKILCLAGLIFNQEISNAEDFIVMEMPVLSKMEMTALSLAHCKAAFLIN